MAMRRRTKRRLKTAGVAGALAAAGVAVAAFFISPALGNNDAPVVSPEVQKYYEENKAAEDIVNPVRFAAVGDSVTEANSPDFSNFQVGTGSWVYYASGRSLEFAGGWSNGGASTASMVANVKPVKADVLIIIAGTNDIQSRPFAESAANVETIVRKVGVNRVIISAIPPLNAAPQLPVEYNKQMKAFAASKGWAWVDAMAPVRDGDHWKAGLTNDGKHPTAVAAQLIGKELSRAALATRPS